MALFLNQAPRRQGPSTPLITPEIVLMIHMLMNMYR